LKTNYNSALRRMIGCKDEDYLIYSLLFIPFTPEQRERIHHKTITRTVGGKFNMVKKPKPYMTDVEVSNALERYEDMGYDRLPAWLKREMDARQLPIHKRHPDDVDKIIAEPDAREHRIMNKELTIQDYVNKYKRGQSLTLIT
jgi:hypothetical protein